jgi:hypothetical protein
MLFLATGAGMQSYSGPSAFHSAGSRAFRSGRYRFFTLNLSYPSDRVFTKGNDRDIISY